MSTRQDAGWSGRCADPNSEDRLDERAQVLVLRGGEDLLGGTLLSDLSLVDEEHPVGNPARVINAESDAAREAAAAKMGFSAYGVTQGDDPVAQAMKGLIDNASGHEHQIALLWQAIEKLSQRSRELPGADCVPDDAHTTEQFDAERLNRLVK